MKAVLLAYVSPQRRDQLNRVCRTCGLEYPDYRQAPLQQWKLLPGRTPFDGLPPPWYDLPDFFAACPGCGGSVHGHNFDWAHLEPAERRPWEDLD